MTTTNLPKGTLELARKLKADGASSYRLRHELETFFAKNELKAGGGLVALALTSAAVSIPFNALAIPKYGAHVLNMQGYGLVVLGAAALDTISIASLVGGFYSSADGAAKLTKLQFTGRYEPTKLSNA